MTARRETSDRKASSTHGRVGKDTAAASARALQAAIGGPASSTPAEGNRVVKAAPIAFDPSVRADIAFQRIAWNCLAQLVANYPLVIAEQDTEALHQSRVALRRLRAAIAVHKTMLREDRRTARLNRALSAVAARLGKARDLDVLIARVRQAVRKHQGYNGLLATVEQQRGQAYAAARDMLEKRSFQQLLRRIADWVENGDWRRVRGIGAAADGLPPKVPRVASDFLRKRRKQIGRAPGNVGDLSESERHQLRIQTKKLRYANEFFAALWLQPVRAARQKALANALERLQDSLGELNDLASCAGLAPTTGNGRNGALAQAPAAALEQIMQVSQKSEKTLLKAANKARADVLAVRRFWKKKASLHAINKP